MSPFLDGISKHSLLFDRERLEMLSREKRAADDRLAICGLKKVMYFRLGLQRNGGRSKGVKHHPHPLFLL